MSLKSYGLTFASHSCTDSYSGFSKDNLGLHVGESFCDKYQDFTINPATAAMKHGENRALGDYMHWITVVPTYWMVIVFF